MQKLLLLIVALGCSAGGWWAGSWSGRDAKAALDKAEELGKAAKAEHDKAQQALNQQLASLTEQYKTESQKLKDAQTEREKSLDSAIAQRDTRLAELAKAHDGKQRQLAQLQAQLAAAATPQERERIVEVIKEVKGEDRVITVEADGRMCQTVPVPLDLLAGWRGGVVQ